MDYQAMYQQKLTTAQEAVKVVKSGDWVDYTWCTNHPVALDKALAERKDELTDVKIRGGRRPVWMPDDRRRPEDAGVTTSPGTPGTAAASTARSSPRAWAISPPCATLNCPVSTGRTSLLWMW